MSSPPPPSMTSSPPAARTCADPSPAVEVSTDGDPRPLEARRRVATVARRGALPEVDRHRAYANEAVEAVAPLEVAVPGPSMTMSPPSPPQVLSCPESVHEVVPAEADDDIVPRRPVHRPVGQLGATIVAGRPSHVSPALEHPPRWSQKQSAPAPSRMTRSAV